MIAAKDLRARHIAMVPAAPGLAPPHSPAIPSLPGPEGLGESPENRHRKVDVIYWLKVPPEARNGEPLAAGSIS
jgi:hypothetical protein